MFKSIVNLVDGYKNANKNIDTKVPLLNRVKIFNLYNIMSKRIIIVPTIQSIIILLLNLVQSTLRGGIFLPEAKRIDVYMLIVSSKYFFI